MKLSRMRRGAPKVTALVYAGYRWFEEHSDDVERWSDKALEGARGKSIERFIAPVAKTARSAARWTSDNNRQRKNESSVDLQKR